MGQIRPEEELALRREAEEALSKGRLPRLPFACSSWPKPAMLQHMVIQAWCGCHTMYAQGTVVCLKLMHSELMVAA